MAVSKRSTTKDRTPQGTVVQRQNGARNSEEIDKKKTSQRAPDLHSSTEGMGAAATEPQTSSAALVTIGVLSFMYGSFIVCRQFFSVTQAAIVSDPAMSLDNNMCANIVVTAGIGFGLAKVVTGLLVDSMDAMVATYAFMACTAVIVLVFSFCESYSWMLLLGFLNAIPQAGGYPALNKIVYDTLPPSQYSTAIAAISVGSRIGASGSYLVLGACLNYLSWRSTIRVAPCFILAAMLASMWALRKNPAATPKPPPKHTDTDTDSPVGAPTRPRSAVAKLRWIMSSGQFWCVTMASACLLVSKGFEAVAPLYVSDVLHLSPATSTMLVATIPAGLVASVLFGNRYLEGLAPRRRAEATVALCGLNFITSCMLCMVTWHLETGGVVPHTGVAAVVCGALFFSLGFSAGYCFYVPQSLFAIEFGGADSATVVGCSELVQAAVAASSLKMAGWLSTAYGWRYVWLVIVFVGITATCCMAAFQQAWCSARELECPTKSKSKKTR